MEVQCALRTMDHTGGCTQQAGSPGIFGEKAEERAAFEGSTGGNEYKRAENTLFCGMERYRVPLYSKAAADSTASRCRPHSRVPPMVKGDRSSAFLVFLQRVPLLMIPGELIRGMSW